MSQLFISLVAGLLIFYGLIFQREIFEKYYFIEIGFQINVIIMYIMNNKQKEMGERFSLFSYSIRLHKSTFYSLLYFGTFVYNWSAFKEAFAMITVFQLIGFIVPKQAFINLSQISIANFALKMLTSMINSGNFVIFYKFILLKHHQDGNFISFFSNDPIIEMYCMSVCVGLMGPVILILDSAFRIPLNIFVFSTIQWLMAAGTLHLYFLNAEQFHQQIIQWGLGDLKAFSSPEHAIFSIQGTFWILVNIVMPLILQSKKNKQVADQSIENKKNK